MAFHRRAEYLLLLFSVTSFVYHWLVLGIILAFLLTLIADPVKLEGEEYFVLFYGDLHQSSWFRPAMLSFSVFCLASQILSITSAASLIKAARKRTSINGSVLLMLTVNTLEAGFGLVSFFVPPFLPRFSGIPRLVWIVKIFLWAVFSFYALQYSKKKDLAHRGYECTKKATRLPLLKRAGPLFC
ncbi:uncharacterized protein LOC135387772 isoform X2 [Ornithodoros turicata]|uniref:uncharacterized protein LOC135387772 isoform X2 n=1 Tax=Ornithodoros turicata TaxID=34597 RepID=UPI0031386D14